MSNRKLGLLVELRDPRAIKQIRAALAKGNGAKAAAIELGIGRTTLTRWGASWEAIGKLLAKHTLDTSAVGSLGGQTTVANRKAAE